MRGLCRVQVHVQGPGRADSRLDATPQPAEVLAPRSPGAPRRAPARAEPPDEGGVGGGQRDGEPHADRPFLPLSNVPLSMVEAFMTGFLRTWSTSSSRAARGLRSNAIDGGTVPARSRGAIGATRGRHNAASERPRVFDDVRDRTRANTRIHARSPARMSAEVAPWLALTTLSRRARLLLGGFRMARHVALAHALCGIVACASACVAGDPGVAPTSPSGMASGMAVSGPPPPPIAEAAPPPPSPDATWVGGYWHWTGLQYAWIPGHWEQPPPGAMWRAPRYVSSNGAFFYEPGGWSRGTGAPAAPPPDAAPARANSFR